MMEGCVFVKGKEYYEIIFSKKKKTGEYLYDSGQIGISYSCPS